MKSILSKLLQKKSITYSAYIVLIGLMLLGCKSIKKNKQKTILLGSYQNASQVNSSIDNRSTASQDYDFDNHDFISQLPALKLPILSNVKIH